MTHELDDSLDSLFGGSPKAPATVRESLKTIVQEVEERQFTEGCFSCGGTGRWKGIRTCFKCEGKGKLSFKTSPEARAKARTSAVTKKVAVAQSNWEDFSKAHPEVAAWMDRSHSFEFAVSLRNAVIKFGGLTERQLAAAYRCVEKLNARKQERAANLAIAPTCDISKIEIAFGKALENGIRRPKLNLGVFTFSRAPDTGTNPGAVYVKEGDTYLGKITDGRFFSSMDEALQAQVVAVASNPFEAAKAYGLRTGECSCCHRTLTNGDSIDRGIGPICAEKFGWGA